MSAPSSTGCPGDAVEGRPGQNAARARIDDPAAASTRWMTRADSGQVHQHHQGCVDRLSNVTGGWTPQRQSPAVGPTGRLGIQSAVDQSVQAHPQAGSHTVREIRVHDARTPVGSSAATSSLRRRSPPRSDRRPRSASTAHAGPRGRNRCPPRPLAGRNAAPGAGGQQQPGDPGGRRAVGRVRQQAATARGAGLLESGSAVDDGRRVDVRHRRQRELDLTVRRQRTLDMGAQFGHRVLTVRKLGPGGVDTLAALCSVATGPPSDHGRGSIPAVVLRPSRPGGRADSPPARTFWRIDAIRSTGPDPAE